MDTRTRIMKIDLGVCKVLGLCMIRIANQQFLTL